jgi:hypothetical protein
MSTHSPSIQPLPPHVVAHIKSATAITSLSTVLLGLLHNALDAAATSIDATIDFARGDCALDDNGLGIPPAEFRPEGCLGKLYCTSKHNAPGPLLGCNGTITSTDLTTLSPSTTRWSLRGCYPSRHPVTSTAAMAHVYRSAISSETCLFVSSSAPWSQSTVQNKTACGKP